MIRLLLAVLLLSISSSVGMPTTEEFDTDIYHPKNNSLMYFHFKQKCSFLCTDEDEVEWEADTTDKAVNSIHEVKPNEKIFTIENATGYDTGVYKCVSKKNPNLFKKLIVHLIGDRPGINISGWPATRYKGHISLRRDFDEGGELSVKRKTRNWILRFSTILVLGYLIYKIYYKIVWFEYFYNICVSVS